MELKEMKCEACEKGTPPMSPEQTEEYLNKISDEWDVRAEKVLFRDYEFDDFKSAFEFVKKIAELAEEQNHHPDILLSYGKVGIELSTHSIGGLSKNDFIMADKIDELKK